MSGVSFLALSIHLLDAATGAELACLEGIEVAINI